MNKVLKGLVAVAATAAMAIAGVAGASTAMAADTVNVMVPNTTNLENHTYTAYQILSGTQATSGGALGDAAWGSGIKGDDFLTALKADTTIGSHFEDVTDAKGFAEALSNTANFPADGANARLVAKIAMKNKQGEGTALTAPTTQLDKGYYLIVDSTANGQTVYNPAVLAITSDIEITDKTDVPTLEKKVQENKKDVTGDTAYGSKFNDVADYNIGDDVPFHLIGSVPDMSQYETYKYTFSDTLGDGFDAPTSVKVYLSDNKALDAGDSNITDSFTITNPLAKTFTVSTNNLKAIAGVATGKYVIVSYTAKLNSSAKIGLPGNVNTADLAYSNKPDKSGTGDTDNTGKTPEDKVIVFTYGLDVTKVDSKNTETKLKDAEFKLYRGTDTKEYAKVHNGKVTGWTADIDEGSVLKSGEDGKFKVEGLDDGDYTLKETKAPAGYNLPANGFSVKLTATTANNQAWGGEYNAATALTELTVNQTDNTGDVNTGLGAITIRNTQGSSLPSTGGMGTTILYAAGAAIVLVAAFGIAFAVRRRNAR